MLKQAGLKNLFQARTPWSQGLDPSRASLYVHVTWNTQIQSSHTQIRSAYSFDEAGWCSASVISLLQKSHLSDQCTRGTIKTLCLASQNKKKVHLDFSTAPEHIRGQEMKDWRFARFLFVSSWFGARFQFSPRNLENLWCYLFYPLSFQRHYKYSINWIILFKLSFQSELFSTTERLICNQ